MARLDGVRWERFESSLWNTTSLLLAADGEALLVDPSIDVDDVAALEARADALGATVTQILITHGDWDHVCGIARFPEAIATMGPGTAEQVRNGTAACSMAENATRYKLMFAGSPRVDRVVEPGVAFRAGPLRVETLALAGHTADGIAYRFRQLDLLAVGDHLSAVEFPFVSSTAHYRATLAGLIETLRSDPPAIVVPGHGRPSTADQALRVAEADLAYLRSLHNAVRESLETTGSVEDARKMGLAVALPRPSPDDLAKAQAANVEYQLQELLGRSPD